MTVKSAQAIAGIFATVSGTGALTAATGTPVGALYVAGVVNAATVTVSGSNPYKWAVTMPTLTVGQTVQMYVTATISGVNTGNVVWNDIADSDTIADGVWDEVLTGATHNVSTSAGRRLRELGAASILSGTATAGATNTITLEAGASTTDNIYNECLIAITAGTGAGQCRMIAEYDGDTLIATVDRNWDVTPVATPGVASEYQIMAFSGILLTGHGTATAGAASTITLASTASAVDDAYIGSMIVLTTSTGSGQARLITDYDGTTKIATISPAWTTTPGAGTVYKIIPVGRAIVESMSAASVDAIWDELLAGHTTSDSAGHTLSHVATLGVGAITFTYTLTSSVDGTPIADADVWVTSDAAGSILLASGVTNSSGVVTFYLDAGTVYVWRQKTGWDFTNPDTEVVA